MQSWKKEWNEYSLRDLYFLDLIVRAGAEFLPEVGVNIPCFAIIVSLEDLFFSSRTLLLFSFSISLLFWSPHDVVKSSNSSHWCTVVGCWRLKISFSLRVRWHHISRLTYLAVTHRAQQLPHIMEQGAHHSLGVLPSSEKQEFVRIQSESLFIYYLLLSPFSALQPNIFSRGWEQQEL